MTRLLKQGLRVDLDRATMAHLASLYPFHSDPGLGTRGPYIGVDVTGGMGAFHFDPFELYAAGVLTNPNGLVIGEVGTGKSALVNGRRRRPFPQQGTHESCQAHDLGPERAAVALDDLRDAERRSGRPARRPPLEVTITPPDGIDAATVERYSELGVDRLVVQPATSGGAEIDDLIEHVGRTLMPAAGGGAVNRSPLRSLPTLRAEEVSRWRGPSQAATRRCCARSPPATRRSCARSPPATRAR